MGHWALGMGHWAWGMGHGAWGIGHWLFSLSASSPQLLTPKTPHSPLPTPYYLLPRNRAVLLNGFYVQSRIL